MVADVFMKTQICVSLKLTAYLLSLAETYLKPSQTSRMELFAKIAAKSFIIDVQLGSKYISANFEPICVEMRL